MSPHRRPRQRLTQLAGALALASLVSAAQTPAAETVASQGAVGPVDLPIKALNFAEALKLVTARSGIAFRLAPPLEHDKIAPTLAGKNWPEALGVWLQGYNFTVETNQKGGWSMVTISGKNGDGGWKPPTSKKTAVSRPQPRPELAGRHHTYPPGSILPVTLPLATLKGMKPGKKITLDLPVGQFTLLHDRAIKHDNGDYTWTGYLDNEGPPFRAMIVMGKEGPMGHLSTPQGDYQFFTEQGQTYLVDINASGLKPGPVDGDQILPNPDNFNGGTVPTTSPSADAAMATHSPTRANAKPAAGSIPSPKITIDLLALYTQGLEQPQTRVNYLVDVANQAFQDSNINARIRLVHSEAVDYDETNANAQALDELSRSKAAFQKLETMRNQQGADLVTLIRPLHARTQGGCGIAWVNGNSGGPISPAWVYSIVSDGHDRDHQAVYCEEHTLAHELGHNLGNVHDRPISPQAGAFPYSYAWGVEGSFGTIMSYHHPRLAVFATPLLGDACLGQPCGFAEGEANAADNARTIDELAPLVARFKPAVKPADPWPD